MHRFTVVKPACMPMRDTVQFLSRYGVKYDYRGEEAILGPDGITQRYIEGVIDVPDQQSRWAEVLFYRAGWMIKRGRIDPRSESNAKKYGGRMPRPWDSDTMAIREADCHAKELAAKDDPRRKTAAASTEPKSRRGKTDGRKRKRGSYRRAKRGSYRRGS